MVLKLMGVPPNKFRLLETVWTFHDMPIPLTDPMEICAAIAGIFKVFQVPIMEIAPGVNVPISYGKWLNIIDKDGFIFKMVTQENYPFLGNMKIEDTGKFLKDLMDLVVEYPQLI
jgi:hypothetical protein